MSPILASSFDYGPTANENTAASDATDLPELPLGNLGGSSLPLTQSVAPSQGGTVAPPSNAGGFTSFFGTRGVAIILGLIFIFGAILLFTGEDIGGALSNAKSISKIAPAVAA